MGVGLSITQDTLNNFCDIYPLIVSHFVCKISIPYAKTKRFQQINILRTIFLTVAALFGLSEGDSNII